MYLSYVPLNKCFKCEKKWMFNRNFAEPNMSMSLYNILTSSMLLEIGFLALGPLQPQGQNEHIHIWWRGNSEIYQNKTCLKRICLLAALPGRVFSALFCPRFVQQEQGLMQARGEASAHPLLYVIWRPPSTSPTTFLAQKYEDNVTLMVLFDLIAANFEQKILPKNVQFSESDDHPPL